MIKLLHVEDDADIREIAKMSLELSGDFVVEQCDCGEQALEKTLDYIPDIFLRDMMMPGMTGRQTLEKLRFMTARAQPNELEELRGIGATEVISKPFDPMSLADQIKAAIA